MRNLQLIYLIGTYPGLTNTFIDQEIATLRKLRKLNINIISIRYPEKVENFSRQQQAFYKETLYLLPENGVDFRFGSFLAAHFYFLLRKFKSYFALLLELLSSPHPNLKARVMTFLYFLMGVYAAFLLRKKNFEHIHTHFMDRAVVVSFIICRMLGKTYSFTAHAADIYREPALMRIKLQNARFVVTVSKFNQEHLLNIDPNLSAEKIHVLHPWVDLNEFTPSSRSSPNDTLHILSVGRLVEKKGHMVLLQACQLLAEQGLKFKCRIVGDGPLCSILEAQIVRNNLQGSVELLGSQPHEQIRELLGNWADVFVLPCIIAKDGDRDGIPVVLAEAMAMGVPVISTDVVGIGELVHSGAGFLIQPHNSDDLFSAIKRVSEMSPEERTTMGRCGRSVVEAEFDLIKGVEELANLFCKKD